MSTTGHAKNVANFETVTIVLLALGTVYNPSQALILLTALQTKLTAAKNVLTAIDEAEAAKKVTGNERAAEFKGIATFAVNIKREAEVSVNDEAFTRDLQSIVRKMRGERAGEKPVTRRRPTSTKRSTGIPSRRAITTLSSRTSPI